ncbi:MAG: 2Fe-2S iron-sulfur cluster binding domain-containing protein [Oscillospiraceae bacterium]|nr:2Fe-2S iron-sulfur cluster binding domain-containing protein [Oscillospiraceae bacterium]
MKKFNFHVKPIGLLDMLHFKKMVPRRRAILRSGSLEPITAVYGVNRLARSLHPKQQKAVVSEIIPRKDAKTYVLKADKLAYFRAGQYVSVRLQIGDSVTTRPYTLAASPALALEGQYQITVKRAQDAFVSDYILSHWEVGTEVTLSGPEGPFSYEPMRDEKELVGIAGGSGITPFMAMANAILDGTEDLRLTLLYGSRTRADILYAEELERICAATDKVKVVHVLSEEQAEGCENGFIGADLIKRYAPETYSLYICGPRAMHEFLAGELHELGLDRKHIRREFVPAPSTPTHFEDYAGDPSKVYTLSLHFLGEERQIPLRADEPVLTAIERAGISAPSHCRSGECGWCRSRLICGEVFIPASMDGRRLADDAAGYIHPCSAWALSDLELEIFPE